jgi:Ca2+-binding EF-hand superfamily protein
MREPSSSTRHCRSFPMLFALGAASSAVDLLKTLMSPKSSSAQAAASTQGTANLFELAAGTTASTGAGASTGSAGSGYSQISPETMSALLAAQGQSTTGSSNSTTSRSDALKDLFSQIDADGDGRITKSEFEDALGAGGTNLAQADDVFSKLDKDSDGSVSLGEMASALKGGGKGGHHHHHVASSDGSSDSGGSISDPLMQALSGASSTSVTNSDGSTTTTLTYADGSKVAMTSAASAAAAGSATSSYNFIEQLIQRQASVISSQASSSVSVSA